MEHMPIGVQLQATGGHVKARSKLKNGSWRIAHDHHDSWDNTASVIEVLKTVAKNGGHYHWNDPDFLMASSFRSIQEDNEYVRQVELVVMTLSSDIDVLARQRQSIGMTSTKSLFVACLQD